MSTSDQPGATTIAAWDRLWRGAGALTQAPAYLSVLNTFWQSVLQPHLQPGSTTAMLDAACGDGAVARQALKVAGEYAATLELTCLDNSHAAIDAILGDHPVVKGVVADARQMTLPGNHFDVVTSQFGLEYAGIDAFAEAARVTARHGTLACVLHLADGALHRECKTQLAACTAFSGSRFLARAEAVFRAGFGALSGTRSAAGFEREQRRFAPAVAEALRIQQHYGPDVASGLLRRSIDGVAQMQQRISHFEADDVYQWLAGVESELTAYRQRMEAMDNAAVDETGLAQIVASVTDAGLTVDSADILMSEEAGPFARRLLFRRQ